MEPSRPKDPPFSKLIKKPPGDLTFNENRDLTRLFLSVTLNGEAKKDVFSSVPPSSISPSEQTPYVPSRNPVSEVKITDMTKRFFDHRNLKSSRLDGAVNIYAYSTNMLFEVLVEIETKTLSVNFREESFSFTVSSPGDKLEDWLLSVRHDMILGALAFDEHIPIEFSKLTPDFSLNGTNGDLKTHTNLVMSNLLSDLLLVRSKYGNESIVVSTGNNTVCSTVELTETQTLRCFMAMACSNPDLLTGFFTESKFPRGPELKPYDSNPFVVDSHYFQFLKEAKDNPRSYSELQYGVEELKPFENLDSFIETVRESTSTHKKAKVITSFPTIYKIKEAAEFCSDGKPNKEEVGSLIQSLRRFGGSDATFIASLLSNIIDDTISESDLAHSMKLKTLDSELHDYQQFLRRIGTQTHANGKRIFDLDLTIESLNLRGTLSTSKFFCMRFYFFHRTYGWGSIAEPVFIGLRRDDLRESKKRSFTFAPADEAASSADSVNIEVSREEELSLRMKLNELEESLVGTPQSEHKPINSEMNEIRLRLCNARTIAENGSRSSKYKFLCKTENKPDPNSKMVKNQFFVTEEEYKRKTEEQKEERSEGFSQHFVRVFDQESNEEFENFITHRPAKSVLPSLNVKMSVDQEWFQRALLMHMRHVGSRFSSMHLLSKIATEIVPKFGKKRKNYYCIPMLTEPLILICRCTKHFVSYMLCSSKSYGYLNSKDIMIETDSYLISRPFTLDYDRSEIMCGINMRYISICEMFLNQKSMKQDHVIEDFPREKQSDSDRDLWYLSSFLYLVMTECRQSTSVTLNLARYLIMALTNRSMVRTDPIRILKKCAPLRMKTGLQSFIMQRFADLIRACDSDYFKTIPSSLSNQMFPSWIFKKMMPVKQSLSEAYLGNLVNKSSGSRQHAQRVIVDKILKQEYLALDLIKLGRISKVLRCSKQDGSHYSDTPYTFSPFLISHGCRELIKSEQLDIKSCLSEYNRALKSRHISTVTTNKATSVFVSDKLSDCYRTKSRRGGTLGFTLVKGPNKRVSLKVAGMELLVQDLEKRRLLQEKAQDGEITEDEFREENLKLFSVDDHSCLSNPVRLRTNHFITLFPKAQYGSAREILVMEMITRLNILQVETLSRILCENISIEMLTSGDSKDEYLMKHDGRVMKAAEDFETDCFALNSYTTSDATTWCQMLTMDLLFHTLFCIIPEEHHNLILTLADVMNSHTRKTIAIPDSILRSSHKEEIVESEHVMRLISETHRRSSAGGEELININNPDITNGRFGAKCAEYIGMPRVSDEGKCTIKNITNMGQGILHYTSSILHAAVLEGWKWYVQSQLKREFPNIKVVQTLAVSSDDSAIMMTVLAPEGTDLDRLRKKMDYLSVQKKRYYRCCGIEESSEKTSSSCPDKLVEFNSKFFLAGQAHEPLIKTISKSVDIKPGVGFMDMMNSCASNVCAVISNGGSQREAVSVLCSQFYNWQMLLGSESFTIYRKICERINKMPHPALGYFLVPKLELSVGLFQMNILIMMKASEDPSFRLIDVKLRGKPEAEEKDITVGLMLVTSKSLKLSEYKRKVKPMLDKLGIDLQTQRWQIKLSSSPSSRILLLDSILYGVSSVDFQRTNSRAYSLIPWLSVGASVQTTSKALVGDTIIERKIYRTLYSALGFLLKESQENIRGVDTLEICSESLGQLVTFMNSLTVSKTESPSSGTRPSTSSALILSDNYDSIDVKTALQRLWVSKVPLQNFEMDSLRRRFYWVSPDIIGAFKASPFHSVGSMVDYMLNYTDPISITRSRSGLKNDTYHNSIKKTLEHQSFSSVRAVVDSTFPEALKEEKTKNVIKDLRLVKHLNDLMGKSTSLSDIEIDITPNSDDTSLLRTIKHVCALSKNGTIDSSIRTVSGVSKGFTLMNRAHIGNGNKKLVRSHSFVTEAFGVVTSFFSTDNRTLFYVRAEILPAQVRRFASFYTQLLTRLYKSVEQVSPIFRTAQEHFRMVVSQRTVVISEHGIPVSEMWPDIEIISRDFTLHMDGEQMIVRDSMDLLVLKLPRVSVDTSVHRMCKVWKSLGWKQRFLALCHHTHSISADTQKCLLGSGFKRKSDPDAMKNSEEKQLTLDDILKKGEEIYDIDNLDFSDMDGFLVAEEEVTSFSEVDTVDTFDPTEYESLFDSEKITESTFHKKVVVGLSRKIPCNSFTDVLSHDNVLVDLRNSPLVYVVEERDIIMYMYKQLSEE